MTSVAPVSTRRRRVLAAPVPAPEPVRVLALDVPVETDLPSPPRCPVVPQPTARCANCGRDGTPAAHTPAWCVACAASPEIARVRAAWNGGA